MCPTRIQPKLQPIELDLTAAFSFEHGFGRTELLQLGPRLEQARTAILEQFGRASEAKSSNPQQMLSEYHRQRKSSLLGRILLLAKQFRETVDTTVILGQQRLIRIVQGLFAACGHPHHNSLSRGQRGGRPRVYFVSAMPDNDALQALFDILSDGRLINSIEERWGLVALDEPTRTTGAGYNQGSGQLLTGLFSMLWDRLQTTTTANQETKLAVFLGPRNSPLAALVEQIGLPQIETDRMSAAETANAGAPIDCDFIVDANIGFHPAVLLAGSVMGLDVVKFLHGAAAIWKRFEAGPVGDNPSLDLGGLCYLLNARQSMKHWGIDSGCKSLQPLADILRPARTGQFDLLVQWLPDASRADRLYVKMAEGSDLADRKKCKDRLLTDLAGEQAVNVRNARAAAGKFTAAIRLPIVDEAAVGQLIMLHALSATVEHFLQSESVSLGKPGD